MSFLRSENNLGLSLLILRVVTGVLMLFHGIHKLVHGHDYIRTVLADHGLPKFMWLGVPVAEVVAPVLLILGVFTRISSLLIVAVMVFSIYLGFGMDAFSLTVVGALKAEANLYFIGVSLALFLSGPGKYAVFKPVNEWLR